MTKSPFLTAALQAAEAAGEVIRRLYRRNLEITIKADKSPVTEADVEAERIIRRLLESRFPDHGFFGEETGSHGLTADYVWLVDPIDGTKSFVREYPMFSTQIALLHDGELVLGVSSAPVYGEIAWAERGQGAWLGDERLAVSDIRRIDAATLSSGNLKTLARSAAWNRYGALVGSVNRIRGYGDFLQYHLLAGGKIDAVLESDVNILDIAALVVIVEEAGGKFTDLVGRAVGFDTTTVLATNGQLHGQVLEALQYG
jgi:histidinol-phosphatase